MKIKAQTIFMLSTFVPYLLFIVPIVLHIIFVIHNGYIFNDQSLITIIFIISLLTRVIGAAYFKPLKISIDNVSVRMREKQYEIIHTSEKTYTVADYGSTGTGLIYLHFIFYIIISPIVLVRYTIQSFLILLKPGYAQDYITIYSKISDDIKRWNKFGIILIVIGFILTMLELILRISI